MIEYRYKQVTINDKKYTLVELLDYDSPQDRADAFDTIRYNHPQELGRDGIVMEDKKTFPSPLTFMGGESQKLHEAYVAREGNISESDWTQPINN